MKKLRLITPQIGSDKGGIQNWMFFVKKLLLHEKYSIKHFAYKEDNPIGILKSHMDDVFILATWKMVVFILPIFFFTKKKIFIFVHGNEILKLNNLMSFFLKFIAKRRGVYFIANSCSISEIFMSVIGREVDFIQHPFMDIDVSNSDLIIEEAFFTIARLVKRKNIRNVLYAFKKLKNEGLSFSYKIAGTGPELHSLKALVGELFLEPEVEFLGRITDQKKNECYASSKFFLLPSVFDEENASIEGYGIVYIEANAYGLPVLSGDTGGMLEAVIDGETGLHCDGSVNDIYLKLKLLLKIDFDKKRIFRHAINHNYLYQYGFVHFLNKKINE